MIDDLQLYNNVQVQWNVLENTLINTGDCIAPFNFIPPTQGRKNVVINTPVHIKNKMNKRKRLLKIARVNNCMRATTLKSEF